MSESNEAGTGPSPDFLKQWQEMATRIMQAAGNFTPETMPPEMLRQIRSGIFQALAKSWEEFMRSPQFLEGMKRMMDNAIAFRRMSNEFLTKVRQETQGTSRQDVDDILLAMREMEARLTLRVDSLAAQVDSIRSRKAPSTHRATGGVRKKPTTRATARKSSGKPK